MNKKNIFLFDGIGAAVSWLFTGVALPFFYRQLGISVETLHLLAVFPLMFLTYSFTCYFCIKDIKQWMLIVIILGNSFYCLISWGVILFYDDITIWGRLLLTLEGVVVMLVVALETKVYLSSFNSRK